MIIAVQGNKAIFNSKFLTRIFLELDYYEDDTYDESPEEEFHAITTFLQGSDYEYTLAYYTSKEQAVNAYGALVSALIKNEPYFRMPEDKRETMI